jgi:cbb3-type cytochrome oxidase maturation protein
MSVVFILVFVAILIASAFLIAFVWAVKSGQYDDTYTPSVRMLFDDPPVKETMETEKGEKGKNRSGQSQKEGKEKGSS